MQFTRQKTCPVCRGKEAIIVIPNSMKPNYMIKQIISKFKTTNVKEVYDIEKIQINKDYSVEFVFDDRTCRKPYIKVLLKGLTIGKTYEIYYTFDREVIFSQMDRELFSQKNKLLGL